MKVKYTQLNEMVGHLLNSFIFSFYHLICTRLLHIVLYIIALILTNYCFYFIEKLYISIDFLLVIILHYWFLFSFPNKIMLIYLRELIRCPFVQVSADH